jgi:lipoprotein-anchoring transpeptidase ErfK/SrfK
MTGIRRRLTAATLLFAITSAIAAGPHSTMAGIDDGPADGTGVATRGTSAQVEATLPPPPLSPGDSFDIPADSGSGRRVVYSKGIQRVWMIEDDGTLYDTHRVSGRADQPNYGTYAVYSRSTFTCSNAHSDICMRWMVRFAHSRRGDNIGFHEIPRRDGVPLQSDDQIGQPLSGGCVRQLTADAIIMWDWAQIGTVVVVVP